MQINEQWKSVEGFEGLYEVSNLGRVKSLNYNRTGVEKVLKPNKTKNGYLYVGLCRNGKEKKFKVHRLVAEAFLPNPEGLPEINHIDENKTNNVVSNIEWASRRYNMNYGTIQERIATALTNHPARSKPVEASKFSDFREICLRFSSTAEAGRNGYEKSHVSSCCRKCFHREGNNRYKNLYWRYTS